jgi:putative tryptophan/tyrosine transport system substrate-binding protein
MRRREFVGILAGVVGWPLIARAQQASKVYRLGYLAPAPIPHLRDALFEALRDLGYVEGLNLKTEYRYGAAEVLEALAVELVALQPDVIVTVGTPPALAAKRATTRLPGTQCGLAWCPVSPDPAVT